MEKPTDPRVVRDLIEQELKPVRRVSITAMAIALLMCLGSLTMGTVIVITALIGMKPGVVDVVTVVVCALATAASLYINHEADRIIDKALGPEPNPRRAAN